MAKPIVLGNGHLTVCLDFKGRVSDVYFPYVGLENHINSHYQNKIGIWTEEEGMFWFEDPSWEFKVKYKKETMMSNIVAVNSEIDIRITFHDIVYNEKNILVRNLQVENLSDRERKIKMFFDHQMRIYDTPHGDTGYYDPLQEAIIHYLGCRAFLFNTQVEEECGFDDYTIGLFGIEGKEGTYKDAEDGQLSQNAIEHGSVSETMEVDLDLPSRGSKEVFYWLTAGESIEEAQSLNEYTIDKGPDHLQKTSSDFWEAWLNKQNFSFYGLSNEVVDLFRVSQLMIRANMDNNGSIIASLDSDMLWHGRDTYSYMWPRDGAYISLGLEKLGDFNLVKRFLQFCCDVIRPEGYFMHKYRSDKSVGSSWHPWIREGKPILPIQEDETALVLIVMWEYYTKSKDIDFIEEIYNDFIKNAAEFMLNHREESTGLPKASYDLWEEKFGISTYTCSTVYGGLLAAGKFADLLGKNEEANKYKEAAEEIKESLLEYLYNEEEDYFYKLMNVSEDGITYDKTIDISSFYGVFMYGILNKDDERLESAFETMVEDSLRVDTEVGGVRRYEGDRYYNSKEEVSGNPWVLATMWTAQYKISTAKEAEDLEDLKDYFEWARKHALESGVLPEQLDPYTGSFESATPLTWSHAEFVRAVVMYLEKLEEFGVCKACYPIDGNSNN